MSRFKFKAIGSNSFILLVAQFRFELRWIIVEENAIPTKYKQIWAGFKSPEEFLHVYLCMRAEKGASNYSQRL